MIKLCLTIFLLASILPAQKEESFNADIYPQLANSLVLDNIDKSHSNISFIASHMGRNKVVGRFLDYSAVILYNPLDISKTSVSISIDVPSLNTGHKWRDEDLRSENWLDAEKYPKITFTSRSSKGTANGFAVDGKLQIKGIEKNIRLKMEKATGIYPSYNGFQAAFYGKTKINRKDFNVIGNNLWNRVVANVLTLGDSLEIEFSIVTSLPTEKFKLSRSPRIVKTIYPEYKEESAKEILLTVDKAKLNDMKKEKAIDRLALLSQLAGKKAKALELYKQNFKLFPKSENAKSSYIKSLLISEKFALAKKLLSQLNTVNPLRLELSKSFK